MKLFASVQPDDAEVLRNGQWIRYDAASLVTGDIIRLEEGDVIPADCVVLAGDHDGDTGDDDLLVDLRVVTGHDRLKTVSRDTAGPDRRQLYMGGKVVQGRGAAMVTNIGPNSLLGTLIQDGRFPPKEPILEVASNMTTTITSVGIQMGTMS
jgi:magnesium-transporting ATPase (P-type)